MKQAILLGDSIRLGYQAVVTEELAGAFEVWSPQANGSTTRYTLEHLDEWVVRRLIGTAAEGAVPGVIPGAGVVHLNCGLHDLAHKQEDGTPIARRCISLEQYKENVERILTHLLLETGLPPRRIVWALTTPVNEQRHQANREFVRLEADVENYNAVAESVVRRLGVGMNDLYSLVMEHDRDELLAADGVHYTDAGYRLLGEHVARAIHEAGGA